MSSLKDKKVDVSVAEIVRHGEKVTLPEDMSLEQAKDLIERRMAYEQQDTEFTETFDVLPLDGAHALAEVLTKEYGWAPAVGTPGMFGNSPPTIISINADYGVVKQVPWGRFSLPNITGFIETDVGFKNGRYSFSVTAVIKRLHEPQVRKLFGAVREYLKTGSIYQGKAVKIRFRNDAGAQIRMPAPEFLDTSKISKGQLVYSADVQSAIETNLFTPIERASDCLANGIPVKRGILLGGTYGTGKTMAATVASRLAVDAGLTYVYVPRADELSDAIEFGKQYQSPGCVVFCEDIDRAVNGERTVEMDDILNILDGIDTKNSHIITVLTTNDLESINPAMLRPGRLDAVIDVTPPDAAAAIKLVRLYGAESIPADTDLTQVGELLAGNIPAIIAEVVKRAKLAQLALQPVGEPVAQISAAALTEAARTMQSQVELLRRRTTVQEAPVSLDSVMHGIHRKALDDLLEPLRDQISQILQRV